MLNDNDTPHPLRDWLRAATDGLCLSAQTRIRAEIEGHDADALAAALEQGLSTAEAERAAITALGSPQTARRQFLKTYLTEREYARLIVLQRAQRPLWAGIIMLVLGNVFLAGCFFHLLQLAAADALTDAYRVYVRGLYALGCWAGFALTRQGRNTLRAHFVFLPRAAGNVRRFKAVMILVWTLFYASLLPALMIQAAHDPKIAGLWFAATVISTVCLLLNGLTIGHEFRKYLPLLQKVDDSTIPGTRKRPDRYA